MLGSNKPYSQPLGKCYQIQYFLKFLVIDLSKINKYNIPPMQGSCNGVELLTEVLRQHSSDEVIVQWGCLALAYLAAHPINAKNAGMLMLFL